MGPEHTDSEKSHNSAGTTCTETQSTNQRRVCGCLEVFAQHVAMPVSSLSPGWEYFFTCGNINVGYWLFRSISSVFVHATFSPTPCESACNSSASESTKRQ